MNSNKSFKNVFFGFFGQIVILALGILVPRFILKSYGDEANGLINAITQIFTYLALIEAGVGQATVQVLYKPIIDGDKKEISGILSSTRRYYRKMTVLYCVAVIIIAVVYPLTVEINDVRHLSAFGSTYLAVFLIVLLQGISNALSFYFAATLKQLMLADGRNYLAVNITTIFRFLLSVAKILLTNLGINLVILQIVYLVITAIEVLSYLIVFKVYYPWVDFSEKPQKNALNEKNAFLIHELSNVVFCSTDMLVLSVFCDLTTVSIYALYNLVFSSLNTLIGQIHNGCCYLLGQAYNSGDKDGYVRIHDAYDTYYTAFVFSIMTVAYILILPFVKLYTAGVTNVNYEYAFLPILFCAINMLSCCRITSSNLIKISGHAKATINRTIIESLINLAVSLVLVNIIGIYGVLIGTIIALLYRSNDMIIYANKVVLQRNPWNTYRTMLVNFSIFAIASVIVSFVEINIKDYLEFVIYGCVITVISIILFFTVNSLANKESFNCVKRKLFTERKK